MQTNALIKKVQKWSVLTLGVAFFTATHSTMAYGETVVTTYVTKVQEERQNTRWTLTEWLRIKERMRMMDLWLAMFSDPKKDHFRPEFVVSYAMTRGDVSMEDSNGTSVASAAGSQGKAQLWLTNLISGTVGIRTLNVDLGIEGLNRTTNRSDFAAKGSLAAASTNLSTKGFNHSWYAGSLRLFGKHVQDTSLTVKYGVYSSSSSEYSFANDGASTRIAGRMAGVDLQGYVFKWLGMEGSGLIYGTKDDVKGDTTQRGGYYDYGGFFEVSLLRITVGKYREDWRLSQDDLNKRITETGYFGGVKLQF